MTNKINSNEEPTTPPTTPPTPPQTPTPPTSDS